MKYINRESFERIGRYIKVHKIISAIFIVVILGVGYYGYNKLTATTGETKYVMTTVKKGTIISTVSGSGQVSASNQIDIQAKVSGDITWLNAKVGQTVRAGQAIAGIDSKTAQTAVSDASAALAQAKLQFQKDQASAPIDYQTTVDGLKNAQDDLVTEYNNTFTAISNAYLDLPAVATGMENTLYGYDLNSNRTQANIDVLKNSFNYDTQSQITGFSDKAEADYKSARAKYDLTLIEYKQSSRTESTSSMEKLLADSIDTTTAITQALQSELNFLGTVVDVANKNNVHLPTTISTMQTNARGYLNTASSDLSALLAEKKSLDSIKQTIVTDQNNMTLLKVGNGTGDNPISLQIEQNNLLKQERDLETLKSNLNDYTIVAPFAGTIASVTATVGSQAGTIASLVTNQQVAQLSLNEIDATKVAIGQKATLTFDAISDLSLTGTVAEIDPVGTVSQGVVSYTIKITFDTQDPRIKPGMTVNASVQSQVRQDILSVPSSAVKTSNGQSYILAFDPPLADTGTTTGGVTSKIAPVQIPVQTGISDDTNIEIISGLTEGQQIVSRTITATSKTTTTTTRSATSLIGGGGGNQGGGIRIGG